MTRGVRLYLVGSIVLVSLAGCGRGFFQTAEREPWRREAEVACLKSGAIKESAELVRINPIAGPGVCGAEFPLKVAAIGESSGAAFGYADDSLRPPAGIGRNQPRWPVNDPPQTYQPQLQPQSSYPARQTYPSQQPYQLQQAYPPQQAYPSQQAYPQQQRPYPSQPQSYPVQQGAGGPVSLSAPGINAPEPDEPDVEAEETQQSGYGQRDYRADQNGPGRYPNPYSRGRSAAPGMPVQNPLPRLGPSNGNVVGSIGPVAIQPTATLACPIVSALDRWIAESVQPAASRWLGARVVEIKQISAYSCRSRNGDGTSKISEHAFGNALDIAAFVLADGRRISVKDGWRGMPEEQQFLREIQGAACDRFTTVLAPGSNAAHYDHIHVDLRRRNRGRDICQPGALSSEQIASIGRGRYAGPRDDPGFTSSVKKLKSFWPAKNKTAPHEPDDDDDH